MVTQLSNSYTLMLCCVSESTPLTRPSERVKALVSSIEMLVWTNILADLYIAFGNMFGNFLSFVLKEKN